MVLTSHFENDDAWYLPWYSFSFHVIPNLSNSATLPAIVPRSSEDYRAVGDGFICAIANGGLVRYSRCTVIAIAVFIIHLEMQRLTTFTLEDHASAAFFSLTASNYIVQITRESLTGVAGKDASAPLLVVTAVASSGLAMIMSWLSGRVSEAQRVFYLLLSWTVFLVTLAFSLGMSVQAARLFFMVSHVATILVSSSLWGLVGSGNFMMHRSFGRFSRFSTYGQAVGSVLSWVVVSSLGNAEPRVPLLLAALMCSFATWNIYKLAEFHSYGPDQSKKIQGAPQASVTITRNKYSYLILMFAFHLLNCMSTSLLYLAKLDAINSLTVKDISLLSSGLNIVAAVSIIVTQSSGFSEKLPMVPSLLALPMFTGAGLILQKFIAKSDDLLTLLLLVVASRVASYALSKAPREKLFSVMDDSDRLRAKPILDGVVCKLGTTMASVFHIVQPGILIHIILFLSWTSITLVLGEHAERSLHRKKVE